MCVPQITEDFLAMDLILLQEESNKVSSASVPELKLSLRSVSMCW